MQAFYSLKRVKTITSHTGHARFLCELSDSPIAYLARVQLKDIPSPYAFSASVGVYAWNDKKVVLFETSHRRFEVFEVPPQLLRFQTDDQATDYHIRFSKEVRS